MQQRQLRLGDILDDYCPRERRVTNHVIVAMIADAVKQTRCSTCDADHEYKHAKVPRQRRKTETPAALYSQVVANAPKRVTHDAPSLDGNGSEGGNGGDHADPDDVEISLEDAQDDGDRPASAAGEAAASVDQTLAAEGAQDDREREDDGVARDDDDGPIHRRLIRAALPRSEGQQPPARPIPEFTIRQPGGRPNRFRPRGPGGGHPRGMGGGQPFQNNRPNGGNTHGGPPRGMRSNGGRPPHGPQGAAPTRLARRNGPGRKRSK